jgi:DNA-binding transcriptional LysR family regulator
MNQLQAMRVFVRVAELASFNLAARQLGMSPTAVTRSVNMLEAHLKMRLLNRTTRSFSLTDVGREYLEGCRTIIEKLDEMEFNLVQTKRDPSGKLRIATPATFASLQLGELLASYRASYRNVDFEVTTYDTQIDPVEGGFDVCFTDDRRFKSTTLISRTLTGIELVLAGSPGYLAMHGVPRTPDALNGHELLCVTDGTPKTWEFSNASGVNRINAGRALSATSSALVRKAALQHMGVALLPREFIKEDIDQGRLVALLESFQINGGPSSLAIVYSGRNYLSIKVRSFVDFVVDQYRKADKELTLRAAS